MTISDFIDDQVQGRRRTFTLANLKLPWPFPVAYALGSSSAMVFGWPVYGAHAPSYVRFTHRFFRALENAKYGVYYRLHPRHRYHMINTRLGYGYHERDDRLLYGAMACLLGYVEDCEHTGVYDPGDEARAIAHWWRVERPADQARYDQLIHEVYVGKDRMRFVATDHPKLSQIVFDPLGEQDEAKQKEAWALQDKIHKDEQAYLHRLIDVRPGMWT
jgi:hypothetical protein